MQERRGQVRRVADRQLIERVRELEKQIDRRGSTEAEDAERKRRHIIRHNCRVAIGMKIGHASGRGDVWNVDTFRIKGRVLDLSAGGASLFTQHELATGQELQLAIQLRDGSAINTHATVRWVKVIPEKGAYASGVQFVNVQAKDQTRIVNFLNELDVNAGL